MLIGMLYFASFMQKRKMEISNKITTPQIALGQVKRILKTFSISHAYLLNLTDRKGFWGFPNKVRIKRTFQSLKIFKFCIKNGKNQQRFKPESGTCIFRTVLTDCDWQSDFVLLDFSSNRYCLEAVCLWVVVDLSTSAWRETFVFVQAENIDFNSCATT